MCKQKGADIAVGEVVMADKVFAGTQCQSTLPNTHLQLYGYSTKITMTAPLSYGEAVRSTQDAWRLGLTHTALQSSSAT